MSKDREAVELLGGVTVDSSNEKITAFLLELLEDGELEGIFDRSLRLTIFGEDKFTQELESYSDEELQDELAERGIVDLRQAIRDIQWRRACLMDVSQDVEELLNTDVG